MNQFDFNFTKFHKPTRRNKEMAPVITFAFPMVKRFDAELDYNFQIFGMRLNSGHM